TLTICQNAPRIPVISSVTPQTAGEGEVITVAGNGFGNNPDNVCIVARFADTAVPLRAIAVANTQIVARVGAVPCTPQPAQIMVGLGEGNVARFVPAFADVIVEDPAWVWRGLDPGALAPANFMARPSADRFGVQWFCGQLVDGRLCVFIRGNWASNTLVQVTARAHTANQKLNLDAPHTRFLGAGTTLQYALQIKNIIQCTFQQQTNTPINITMQQQADGSVKITVTRADGEPIVWGLLNICVSQPVTFPEEFPVHMNINI